MGVSKPEVVPKLRSVSMSDFINPIRPKWQGTMTDRERFNAQMHYQPVDRCFNMEFGYWNENFIQWPIFVENNIITAKYVLYKSDVGSLDSEAKPPSLLSQDLT